MLVTAASVGTFNLLCLSIIDSHMGIGTKRQRSTSLLLGKSQGNHSRDYLPSKFGLLISLICWRETDVMTFFYSLMCLLIVALKVSLTFSEKVFSISFTYETRRIIFQNTLLFHSVRFSHLLFSNTSGFSDLHHQLFSPLFNWLLGVFR